jgi:hypothetical protein
MNNHEKHPHYPINHHPWYFTLYTIHELLFFRTKITHK